MALSFIMSILDIFFLGWMLIVVNGYTQKKTLYPPWLLSFFSVNNALLPIAVFLLLFGCKNWLGYKISSSQHHFCYQVASRLSRQNIWNYLEDDYHRFIHIDSSVLIRNISQQPIEFSAYILTNLQQVVTQSMLICCAITAILFYHPLLFLLLFLLLLPPVLLSGIFIRKKLKTVRTHIKISGEKTIQHLQEALSGFVESNIYHKASFFTNRYQKYQQQLNTNIAVQHSLQELPSRLIEVFALLGFFFLVAIHTWFAHSTVIDLLSIGVFVAGAYKIIPGIVKILNSTGQIKTYLFILNDLLPADKNAGTTTLKNATAPIQSIIFEKVNFQYQRQLLQQCSFEINTGDFVGISGNSGAGKTTLINLLLGFLDPEDGNILVNRQLTGQQERQCYWHRISYVKQQPFFINDSILKNITLTDGTYNEETLQTALSFCGIDQMLTQYADGIHHQITENGKNISGGQRQRIMLARALYHDFDLLILDEPFSEMDDVTEQGLLAQLALLAKKGKIILMVTHRKASLAVCNKIIMVDHA